MGLIFFASNYNQNTDQIRTIVDQLKDIDLEDPYSLEHYLSKTSGHARKLFVNGQARYFINPALHGSSDLSACMNSAIQNYRQFDAIGRLENIGALIKSIENEHKISLPKISNENVNPINLKLQYSDQEKAIFEKYVNIDIALFEFTRHYFG